MRKNNKLFLTAAVSAALLFGGISPALAASMPSTYTKDGVTYDYHHASGLMGIYYNTDNKGYALVTYSDNTYATVASSKTGTYTGNYYAVSGSQSSVSGGAYNTASGTYSSVSGGAYNTASGTYSSVSGGHSNTASGKESSAFGGTDSVVQGHCSVGVAGGSQRLDIRLLLIKQARLRSAMTKVMFLAIP